MISPCDVDPLTHIRQVKMTTINGTTGTKMMFPREWDMQVYLHKLIHETCAKPTHVTERASGGALIQSTTTGKISLLSIQSNIHLIGTYFGYK
jgi:hypothetical protein